jgi:hypothetical protein
MLSALAKYVINRLIHGLFHIALVISSRLISSLGADMLDKDDGCYVNNVTREKVPVREAIMKGFIKARLVKDPSKLSINPNNNMVIEKFSTAKAKIMQAVKISKAFIASIIFI